MKTAVIISEYNPFHNGHQYQIDRLRTMLGEVCIIAIMSGSFTQRGEPAIFPKHVRAQAAVDCGISLVLELPFPYSCNSAEFFAEAAVSIADRLGVVDYLCFGSESGELSLIETVSDKLSSEEFRTRLFAMQRAPENAHLGRAALTQQLYAAMYNAPEQTALLSRPNDILAIEYLSALKRQNSSIRPLPVRRFGAEHNSTTPPEPQLLSEKPVENHSAIASATSLRTLLRTEGAEKIAPYVPENAYLIYRECIEKQRVADMDNLTEAILAFFRLTDPDSISDTAEITGGLNYRLCSAAKKATSLESFFALAHTKRYTLARIRRAVWNCLLAVTEKQLKTPPAYTQLLATDDKGREVLRRMKKCASIPILTKPSDYKLLPENAHRQAAVVHRADALFTLALAKSAPAFDFITQSPYLKK